MLIACRSLHTNLDTTLLWDHDEEVKQYEAITMIYFWTDDQLIHPPNYMDSSTVTGQRVLKHDDHLQVHAYG